MTQPVTPRARGDSEAPHLSPVTPAEDARTVLVNQISWGAVFAGILIALIAQLLLNLLGVGIGLTTLDSSSAQNSDPKTLSIAAGVWWAISGILSAFAGGYAAGRLSGRPKESTTGWHGLTAWAGATLVVLYLITSAVGSLIGGAFSAVSGAMAASARSRLQQPKLPHRHWEAAVRRSQKSSNGSEAWLAAPTQRPHGRRQWRLCEPC